MKGPNLDSRKTILPARPSVVRPEV